MLGPELERRRFPFSDPRLRFSEESSIDLLAINSSGEVIANEDCLSHDRLLAELGRLNSPSNSPALQVLFVNSEPLENTGICALSLATANYLCDRLGVPPSYIAGAASWVYGHPEMHRRERHGQSGGPCKEECWYSCYISPSTAMTFVWFSYGQGAATYVVTWCDKGGLNNGVRRSVAEHIEGGHAAALLRPLAIDIIIAEVTIHLRREKMRLLCQQLNRSVNSPEAHGVEDPGEDVSSQVRELHGIAYDFITDGACVTDTEEILTFLLGVHEALNPYFAPSTGGREYPSVTHSLSTLLSEASRLKRILQGEIDRAQSVIDLFRHLSSDAIVQATRRTALETRKDNTAMITMAALTMLFLPGTFVSGIFSMDFLGPLPGVEASSPGSRWWLYPATTVPLTTLVFVVWKLWMSRRIIRRNGEIGGTSEHGDIPREAQSSVWPILQDWLTFVLPWSRTKSDIETGEHSVSHPYRAPQTSESHQVEGGAASIKTTTSTMSRTQWNEMHVPWAVGHATPSHPVGADSSSNCGHTEPVTLKTNHGNDGPPKTYSPGMHGYATNLGAPLSGDHVTWPFNLKHRYGSIC